MASFGTDFHATLDELMDLIDKWMREYPVIATAQYFPPTRLIPMHLDNFRELLALPGHDEVLFTEGPITKPATSVYQALGEHPNGLCLNIGRLGPTGLPRSSLSTMHATPLWSRLNRELKKLATAGANCVWNDGNTTFDRNARFTAGAKALAASGVPLREYAQAMRYHYLPK